jgi:hypothetical protein
MSKLKIFPIILLIIILSIFFINNKRNILYLKWFLNFLKYNNIKKIYIKKKNSKKLNKEAAYKILEDVTNILQKYNIFFWLSEGTALGVFREGDLIDHDDDVDLSFQSEYFKIFKDKVIPELEKLGYVVDNFHNLYYIMNKNIFIDIDILFENDLCAAKYWKPVKELEPHIKDFYVKEFRGYKYNLPKESYYEYLYGKDYMIPLRKKPDK